MKIPIKNKVDPILKVDPKLLKVDTILFEHECENNTIKLTLEIGVKKGACFRKADLRGADLRGAYLRGADLRDTDFCNANLSRADLREADLGGADLREAYFRVANLRGANLHVKYPPLFDRDFISEILWKQAKTEEQKDFASRILRQDDGCWEYFYKLAQSKQVSDWAEKVLSQWKVYANMIEELKQENELTRI